MLAAAGLRARTAWQFSLYGGTVLLAAGREQEAGATGPDETVQSLLAADVASGVTKPDLVRGLQHEVSARAGALRAWLTAQRDAGNVVLGYAAASRAVALLRAAGVDNDLLPAVADASPGKVGLRMPGTAIPVITPAELTARAPDAVLVFVSDLIPEVRRAFPQIEAAGATWVDADSLGAGTATGG
jgi:hypothetical protein